MLSHFDIFKRKQRAYEDLFSESSKSTQIVIGDLKKFCRYMESTYDPDPYRQSYLNGRRDVLERILSYVDFSPEQMHEMQVNDRAHKKKFTIEEEED